MNLLILSATVFYKDGFDIKSSMKFDMLLSKETELFHLILF